MQVGLDRLLAEPAAIRGRRYALLSHQAALSAGLELAHLALADVEPPRLLLGPEHGFYGVEQDMVAAGERVDPLTGIRTASLYGASADSLRPDPAQFADLDLLVIDLQDVGARYYTFAATAVWAARAALEAGCEVLVLDRPNPLGGSVVTGGGVDAGYESFVGAFDLPVRHGLTMAEIIRLGATREGWPTEGLTHLEVAGWRREQTALAWSRPWLAPSPNMPSVVTAFLYPGLCLVEGTTLSEGRGTTRPFQLVGAPGIDARTLAETLRRQEHAGVAFVPAFFRPQFQKHGGEECGGVELVVTEPERLDSWRLGAHLVATIARLFPEVFAWRAEAYEFVSEIPAIDLLTGSDRYRRAVEDGTEIEAWLGSLRPREQRFREERREVLLYSEE